MEQKIIYLGENNTLFSSLYSKARTEENRILHDEVIKKLPHLPSNNPNYKEWKLRVKSTQRFVSYLESKKSPFHLLDVGCGNGWFLGKLQHLDACRFSGIDIHLPEIIQANRVFGQKNTQLYYGNLMDKKVLFPEKVDLIVFNASIQYFEDIKTLLDIARSLLKKEGEIHIIDSPFYEESELQASKERSLAYYTKIGTPEMASFYFQHSKEAIKDFQYLYRPKKGILQKIIKDSPFPWLRWTYAS